MSGAQWLCSGTHRGMGNHCLYICMYVLSHEDSTGLPDLLNYKNHTQKQQWQQMRAYWALLKKISDLMPLGMTPALWLLHGFPDLWFADVCVVLLWKIQLCKQPKTTWKYRIRPGKSTLGLFFTQWKIWKMWYEGFIWSGGLRPFWLLALSTSNKNPHKLFSSGLQPDISLVLRWKWGINEAVGNRHSFPVTIIHKSCLLSPSLLKL